MSGESHRFARTLETAERDGEIARLRSTGMSFADIGAQFGISRQAAHQGFKRALAETVREASEDVRVTELARLDRLYQEALAVLAARHLVVQNGRVVRDADGEPLVDPKPRLGAIDRALKVQERRAKLLGLDAPTKNDVRVTDSLDSRIEQLAAELGFMENLAGVREDGAEGAAGPGA